MRDPGGRVRVSAVLDFEMALAGDGAFDLAYLAYQDARDEHDLAAILRGYGAPSGPPSDQPAGPPATCAGLRRRLLLYQVPQALEHLWWVVSFRDETATARVLARLRTLVDALEPRPTSA